MPISIVVGGQFGSEGKGKVALGLARLHSRQSKRVTLVRVGGTNSGHTGYDKNRKKFTFRQLPAGCIDRNVDVVFPSGSYIDPDILRREVEELNFPENRIFISEFAQVITKEHKEWENNSRLKEAIGSTGSGTGAAVIAHVAREANNINLNAMEIGSAEIPGGIPGTICDTTILLRKKLRENERIIIEGTQGFGLSLLDGGYWPKATSRSTTAAAALSETGLSPLDVDDITLVLRSHPIRVAGDSGELVNQTTWEEIARKRGTNKDLREFTTVTGNLRRVGEFDAEIVKRAIAANNPNCIVLNHLDYVGQREDLADEKSPLNEFINRVEHDIGQRINWYGFSEFENQTAHKVGGLSHVISR